MSQKEVHFRLPLAVWQLWVQVMPGYGERTAFMRRAVGLAIKAAKWRNEYSDKADKALKEMLDGTAKQDYRQSPERADTGRLHSIAGGGTTKSPEDTGELENNADESNDKGYFDLGKGNSIWEDDDW